MTTPSKNTIRKAVKGKNVIITGGSSGIGEATAMLLGEAGAHVILLARSKDKLEAVASNIKKKGYMVSTYPCDLTDESATESVVAQVLSEHKHVDVLINNAGRSIRRSVVASTNRFHDFERTMKINYFGAVKLILELLPNMTQREEGHIVNVLSVGILTNSPRFSAYVASKAALEAFSRCLAAEVKGKNVNISNVYMPLVRTPMIAPTKLYENMPALSTEEAALFVARAVVDKSAVVASRMGRLTSASNILTPEISLLSRSFLYQLFPDSDAKDVKLNLLQRGVARVVFGAKR